MQFMRFKLNKSKLVQVAVFAAFLVALALIRYSGPAAVTVQPAGQRKSAASFTLEDASGEDVKLSEYQGKVVLLNFWATWCQPCNEEIPWFIEFENRYREQGLAVLGVSMDETGWKAVRPYVQARKMNYPVMLASRQVAESYGPVDALPTTFIIDRSGNIAGKYIGVPDRSTYENKIQELLAEP